MAAPFHLLHGGRREAAFNNQDAGTRGARPERKREMLDVPSRRVDGLLQVHLRGRAGEPGVAQEQLAVPLVLLVAAGRAPAHVRDAVPQRHAARQRGARALAGCQRGRQALVSQNICPRVPSGHPSSGITGEDCSQPPDGVAVNMLPALSMTSMCVVSPRTSPSRETSSAPWPVETRAKVGSPAPAPSARALFTITWPP